MQPTFLTPFRVLWKRRTLEASCSWSRAQLELHQERRLAALRRAVRERSPFYRRFHRGLENQPLSALPVLTKATMMENFDDLVTDRCVRLADAEAFLRASSGGQLFHDRYVALSTSGSTGRRGVFLFDPQEWLTALAMITRPMAWAGLASGWRKPPRSAMIASTTPWHYSTRISASLSSRLLPALRLDAAEPMETMVRRLNEWQPAVLAAYPSVLRQLADAQIAGDLRIALKSVATSAEVLPEETRRRVHRAWGVRVFDTYGATEYAPIAAECAYGRKHLFEDGAIIEVVDDRGRPVPGGTRGDRLLLTIFDRQTQPLIRYEISDMVRPLDGACECGRPFGLIESIEGRIEDVLYFPRRDGRPQPVSAHPNLFHQILETVPAAGWQVRQEDNDVSVSLAGLRDQSICETLPESLRLALETQGAAVGAIRVRAVEVLERGRTGKAPLILRRVASSSQRDLRSLRRPSPCAVAAPSSRRHHDQLTSQSGAQNRHRRRLTDAIARQQSMEIVDPRDRFVGEPQNHVAVPKAGGDGGAVGLDRRNQDRRGSRQLVGARERSRHGHVLSGHAHVTASDVTIANQLCRHEPRRVAGNREAQSLSRQNHRGIDADHFAAGGHQRPAGVAGIERRIGLNHVVHQPARARAQRSAERADDAGGHRVVKAIGIADGNRHLADADRPRIAERGPRQRRSGTGVRADDREIRVDVASDRIGTHRPAVRQHHPEVIAAFHHVTVGEHQTIGREHHAGSAAVVDLDFHDRRAHDLDRPDHGA